MNFKKYFCMIMLIAGLFLMVACGQGQRNQDIITVNEFEPDPGSDAQEVNAPETPQEAFPVKEEAKIEVKGVWEGYKDLDFAEFFKQGISGVYASPDSGVVEKCDISISEGWDCEGFLDESSVAEGNQPVSYIVYLTIKSGETTREIGYKFYMERTADGVLIAKGSESFISGDDFCEVFNDEETKALLDGLKEGIK